MHNIGRKLFAITLWAGFFLAFLTSAAPAEAAAGVNGQMNFQGRLLNSQGAVVADGYYNIEFKIYQDGDGQSVGDTTGSPAGTLKWTEDWLNSVSTQGVEVKNGYLSVQLGSRTAFGTSINWNSDTLWLSMQVGNTSNCTITTTFQSNCGGDGEMTPMKRLSSSPYALNSGELNGLSSAQFLQLAQGVQADSSNVSSIFVNKTGTNNIVQLQSGGNDAFVIGNTGDVSFGANVNHTISVAAAAASAAGKSLTVAGGAAGSGGSALAGGNLTLNGGAGGGTNGNGGSISIDGGAANGSGTNGSVNIGTNNAGAIAIGKAASAETISLNGGNGGSAVSIQTQAGGTVGVGSSNTANTVQVGSSSLSSGTQSVNIGNNNTAGGTTNVTIGAGGSASGGATAIQSKGNTTLATNGVLRATLDNLNNLYLGNGATNSAPNSFTVSGTGSTTSGTSGGALTVKGGDSTSGNTNGGNLVLSGGAGAGTGVSGGVIVRSNGSDATNAFQVQKSDGTTVLLGVDTKNSLIGLGAAPTAGGALVQVGGTLTATSTITGSDLVATSTVKTGASGGTTRIDASGNLTNIGNITGTAAVSIQGGAGTTGTTGTNGGSLNLAAGAGGDGTTTNGNGGDLTLSGGAAGAGNGTAGVQGSVIVKNPANSAVAFQVQNSSNSKAVLAVDTTNNQIVLGAPGAGGLTGQIKLYKAGSTGSITLIMADPGSNNDQLTIPAGGGIICTTANALCSGGSGGGTGLAKNAVDTSQADANTAGYLYAFANVGTSGTGGVLSLDNTNNTGAALYIKDTSTKAFQVQTSAGYNSLVLDTSATPTHLKIYDGTATQAYADIYYSDSSNSAIFTASTGTAQFGGGSVPTLLSAGSGQAVTITGHTSSSWTLDSGDLTLDVTGTTPNLNIATGAAAKTLNLGNQTGATAINIKSGSGNVNFIPVGTGNTGVIVKPTNASTLAFQVQNSTTSKSVMSVDNSGNQVVVGDGSSSGITGKLAFSVAGASGKIVLTPGSNPGSSTFTLQLPSENGTLCSTAGSAACLAVYGGGVGGSFLAKDATDTSGADSGAGYLYTFTNNGIAGSGGVLKLNNSNNTGSTLSAVTSGNPDSGKAVIYAQNTNATPSGNLLDLEAGATPVSVFSVDTGGKLTAATTTLDGSSLTFGAASAAVIQPASSQALTITGHASSTWSLDAGDLSIATTAASSNLTLDSGAGGTLALGASAATINVGNTALASGTQTINIGTSNTSGGTTNVVLGAGASASGGTTAIQSKGNTTIATNGTTRATFDTSGSLYLGNGASASSPANFTIRGTSSSVSGVAGASVTLQGGDATVGSANGGNISIKGGSGVGSGVSGLVLLSTPTFSTTTNDPNCYTGGALVTTSCTIAGSSVDGSAAILVGFSTGDQVASLPAPTLATAGRVVYITAANGSQDFTLEVNGGGTGNDIAMRQNTSATMIWNGVAWTAAGASSSTTLQSAYDNTLQSAGGAELVVSHTGATNGLTIRDSSVNPVNGTLLSVQTNSAATIISINGNVTEYATDAGAETAGGTVSTFPSGSWGTVGSASVSRYTTVGNFINTGEASVAVTTTTAANDGVSNTLSDTLTANLHYNVSFAARLSSGTFTDMNVYYSIDGTSVAGSLVVCTNTQIVPTSVWTKVNCTFAAPTSGITSANALLIRQTGSGTARTFYVDNLSVTIGADYNYATDGGVDDSTNFSTNWTSVSGSSVSRDTSAGNDASDSAKVITTGSGQGIRNKLSIKPLASTLYRVTVYAASTSSGFNSFTVRYSPNGGTNFVSCADYNTQSISSIITDFTEITCYINTDNTTVSNPYVYFTQSDATGRTFNVDTFSMTLSTNTTPNVQIGGGINGGPVTLLTLDRAASAPIASNNDAFLGSMYYDTSLGELQCYEADGWGSCGSSPNTVVTISPEYNNAVMHGTGVGTMTSDICSDTLNINDGSFSQPTICGSNETFNFYKWTSPQTTPQTYSIYVTYQLPDTFKTFASGQTSLMGRTDSSNATVQYTIYRNYSGGLTACGSAVQVSTGASGSWTAKNATGAADPSTCGFAPDDSIVFKIDVIASQNADAYVGNLNFIFSHK